MLRLLLLRCMKRGPMVESLRDIQFGKSWGFLIPSRGDRLFLLLSKILHVNWLVSIDFLTTKVYKFYLEVQTRLDSFSEWPTGILRWKNYSDCTFKFASRYSKNMRFRGLSSNRMDPIWMQLNKNWAKKQPLSLSERALMNKPLIHYKWSTTHVPVVF